MSKKQKRVVLNNREMEKTRFVVHFLPKIHLSHHFVNFRRQKHISISGGNKKLKKANYTNFDILLRKVD